MYYFLARKARINMITVLVAIFQSSSGYRPKRGQTIDVWAKLLGRLTSSLLRFGRREGGGATNIPSVISHGDLSRLSLGQAIYQSTTTSQKGVASSSSHNQRNMDRLKLLSTTASASKRGRIER